MLKLINNTQFSAGLYSGRDKNGQHQLTCVIKAGFSFDQAGNLSLINPAPEIEEVDRYLGDPNKSSLVAANEIMPYKEKSEILVYGIAHPPTVKSIITEVGIRIHWSDDLTWEKQLRVFGKRVWQKTLFGRISGKPELLLEVPIRYEYAYKSSFNPAGISLPQIEQGPRFINKPADKVKVAGFGPIPPAWHLRDIFNMAPDDQQFERFFIGGEKITLKGLFKSPHEVSLVLPKIKPKLTPTENICCDTLIIDTDKKNLQLIWRAGVFWHVNDQRRKILTIL